MDPSSKRSARQRDARCRARAVPVSLPRRQWLCGLLLAAIPPLTAMRAQSNGVPLVAVLVSTGLHALDYLRQGMR